MAGSAQHTPVLLERCLTLLAPALDPAAAETSDTGDTGVPDGGGRRVVVDATLGLGGHSEALLQAHPDVRLVGLDRDPAALAHSGERLAAYADRTALVHAVYDELPAVLSRLGIAKAHGILFDLGVSSMQLDESARGFAYAQDAPLDMRMDPTSGITAGDVVNTYDAKALARVLRVYGEERFAKRIADAVVRERATAPLTSTAHLAELVRDAVPAATRRTGGHPAKRTFQALRIEVNGELAALEGAIPAALDALAVGGRIVVMAYQSLEDRIVKRALASGATSSVPHDVPVIPAGHQPWLRLLTRGAEVPTEAEVAANPRAASARLRAAQRTRTSGPVAPTAGPQTTRQQHAASAWSRETP